MKKIKMKTKRALAKRIKVTASGEWKRKSAFTSHIALSKTTKQKRQLRKRGLTSITDITRLERGMPYKR